LKVAGRKRRLRQREQRWAALKRDGWVEVTSSNVLEMLDHCGIRMVKLKPPPCANGSGRFVSSKNGWVQLPEVYAPGWAITIISNNANCGPLLRRAKASVRERRAILTEIELKKGF
jgi:hypothetical protein